MANRENDLWFLRAAVAVKQQSGGTVLFSSSSYSIIPLFIKIYIQVREIIMRRWHYRANAIIIINYNAEKDADLTNYTFIRIWNVTLLRCKL